MPAPLYVVSVKIIMFFVPQVVKIPGVKNS